MLWGETYSGRPWGPARVCFSHRQAIQVHPPAHVSSARTVTVTLSQVPSCPGPSRSQSSKSARRSAAPARGPPTAPGIPVCLIKLWSRYMKSCSRYRTAVRLGRPSACRMIVRRRPPPALRAGGPPPAPGTPACLIKLWSRFMKSCSRYRTAVRLGRPSACRMIVCRRPPPALPPTQAGPPSAVTQGC